MKDTKLTLLIKREDSKNKEKIDFNLTKGVAEVNVTNDEGEVSIEESKELFDKKIPRLVKLAKKESASLDDKIKNNKLVIALAGDNEVELKKARRHLKENQDKQNFLNEWIKN